MTGLPCSASAGPPAAEYVRDDGFLPPSHGTIFVIKQKILRRRAHQKKAFKAAIGDRVSRVMDVKYAFQQLDELPEGYTLSLIHI